MTLLVMWLSYTFFGVALFSLVFLWAVRTRQFSDPGRAARLVIEDLPPPDEPSPAARSRAWRVMLVPAFLLLAGALVVGGTAVYVFTR